MAISHPFPPLFDNEAKILILGSFPSVKSRETGFFYGHKQNRFWSIMAELLMYRKPGCGECEDGKSGILNTTEKEDKGFYIPVTVEEKTDMLKQGHVALWDTIKSCEITGSSDQSITDAVPNDLGIILKNADIEKVCCNGTKSYELFMKYTAPSIRADTGIGDTYKTRRMPEFIKLPSTSPANAAWSRQKLLDAWKELTGIMPISYE